MQRLQPVDADLLIGPKLGVQPGETDRSGRFTLRTVRCLGLCALSPAMKIDGQSFGRVNVDRVGEILEPLA